MSEKSADDKRVDHLKRRHKQLGSIRKTADEFDMSKSNVHRVLKQTEKELDE